MLRHVRPSRESMMILFNDAHMLHSAYWDTAYMVYRNGIGFKRDSISSPATENKQQWWTHYCDKNICFNYFFIHNPSTQTNTYGWPVLKANVLTERSQYLELDNLSHSIIFIVSLRLNPMLLYCQLRRDPITISHYFIHFLWIEYAQ